MSATDAVTALRLSGREHRAVLVFALLGLALRLAVAMGDPVSLDRLFVPDDTYYTLSIARSMAHGLGPTADGSTPTNGFQPLLAFLLVPVFAATKDPEIPLRVAMVLLAICDAFVAWLLAVLARRLFPERAALAAPAAAALWAASPVAIANALGGLETTLSLACTLGLVASWASATGAKSAKRFVVPGALAGLALLARIDTAFVVAALGLHELVAGSRRGLVVAAAVAALVVAPWWAYELATLGTVVPESGAAVREQAAVHRTFYLTLPMQLAWGAGSLVGPPFLDLPALRELLLQSSNRGAAIFVLVSVLGGRWIVGRFRAWPSSDARRALVCFTASTLGLVWFYATAVPVLWFFRRYFAPAHAVLALAFAGVFAWLVDAAKQQGRARRALARVGLVVFAIAFTVGSLRSLRFVSEHPSASVDLGLNGAKGYRRPARQILAALPPGARVGALQSGALSYFAPIDRPDVRVVNLDGVVDGRAARAFRSRTLADYARSRGLTHLSDWPFNVEVFGFASERAVAHPRLRLVAEAELQGPPSASGRSDRFLLCQLVF